MRVTKWITAGLLTLMLSATFALANGDVSAKDSDSTVKKSTDTSRNPLTGTVTVTKKYKKDRTAANNVKEKADVKEVTKYKKDGTIETKKTTEESVEVGE